MKLAQWRKLKGLKQAQVAAETGVSQSFISLIERSIEPQTPNADVMRRVYILTEGAVQPNDFYDIPSWEAARIRAAAEAELARRAA